MISNRIRFSGMASGMDTDSIVKDMMRPQQYKIDMQKKAQALVQLKQDAWKDMNKKLYDFHRNFTDKLRFEGTFKKNITTTSNTDAMSIASGATVPQGTHTFDVMQLAESISTATKVTDTTVLEAVNFEFVVEGKGVPGGNNKITIELAAGGTLEDVAKQISEQLKKNGFSSSYSDSDKVLFVNSANTGEGEKINIGATTSEGKELLKKLGLVGTDEKGVEGKDAKYKYNGVEFSSASNTIEVNGIKANLKAANTGIVTISSQTDPEAIYTFVKEFITEYNKLIDDINTKLGTKPGKNIQPLTAEERKSMSESEIKLWEDKLNSSLFYKDEQLTEFTRISRNILGKEYTTGKPAKEGEEGKELSYKMLASLGIVTGPWQEQGKLHIEGDEDDSLHALADNKLKEAIASNPDQVIAFFTTLGADLYKTHEDSLISSELKSARNFYNDKTMTKKMQSYEKTIASLEERMSRMEEMQYKKFAAMEKMLSSLNSQGSWLSQQFGG